ncbi:ABC transporter permease [Rhizobium sp. ICMP 5592]|nr:ABC transporter permease [Rhizobium sp. ICMP 5592]
MSKEITMDDVESKPRRIAVQRVFRSARTSVGLGLMILVAAVAVFGPFFAPYGATELVGVPFDVPQYGSPLGMDFLGRDVYSRFLNGGSSLVWMSLSASALGLVLGALIGLSCAFYKGWTDMLLMRLVDVKLAFPSVIFVLLIVTVVGPGKALLVILVGISQAPSVSRVIRGAALSVVNLEYVQYCRAIGLSGPRIIATQILPNVATPLLVEAGLRLMWSISLLAGLSFLGYGIQPPSADWGVMINENRNALSIQPWAVIAPIAAIAVFTIGGNIFAEAVLRSLGRTDSGKD